MSTENKKVFKYLSDAFSKNKEAVLKAREFKVLIDLFADSEKLNSLIEKLNKDIQEFKKRAEEDIDYDDYYARWMGKMLYAQEIKNFIEKE